MSDDWEEIEISDPSDTDFSPLPEDAESVTGWRRVADVVYLYSDGDEYWILIETGGMQRACENYDDEDEAYEEAAEWRDNL